ncbi:MAG: lytic murein transglycosylase [Sulfurimonas sp.]|uniref:lytic murein transglycosylase n=1 Tax=Sulfurimonas sp. TaxID=2022749 RepID=UPI00260D1130|nr:lytic murein transglycosylase [Sulfurimonas sp.]MDD2651946.1 lytic murein transglycosylase [Sulfurimonas sp.]MDD3451928.1 lytic murein transglycosylase [Sulfurimonas sp.]
MGRLFFPLFLATLLFAKYDNCNLKNKIYQEVCQKAVQKGVSYDYANAFLLSSLKTKKFDEKSYEYLQPKYIKIHRKNEKKANNTLVKYISEMVAHLKEHVEVYDFVEAEYGVNREIIAAILIKETRLGKIKPTHDAFIVFNTLALRTKPNSQREKWLLNMGKANMVSIIVHCYKRGVAPEACNLPSSYAGAVGIPQFMPSSFVYAKGYKTKVGDLTKMEDAIVSTANYLHQKGEFKTLLEWDKAGDVAQIETEWYDFEFNNEDASFVYSQSKKNDAKYQCFTCDKEELAHLREYAIKIMSYNNSSNYAVGVMRLAYEAHRLLQEELVDNRP